jgi:signal transduction histidine kinase
MLLVSDDGIGGADPGRGSGLVGLRDRVEAVGGSLQITTKPDVGISLVASLQSGTNRAAVAPTAR